MKKTIALALVLVFCLALLAGCDDGSGDELKGTWKGTDSNGTEITFVIDGKGGVKFTDAFFSNKEPGTYTITGKNVEIKVNSWDTARNYSFAISGDKLTLTAPDDMFYVGFDLTKS
jgi:hypothetical protein